jgi:hypothetical protein
MSNDATMQQCNNVIINFQGSRFSTKDFKDNNGDVFVKKNSLT